MLLPPPFEPDQESPTRETLALTRKPRHPWLQFLAVRVAEAIFLWLAWSGLVRPSPLNMIWVFGLPVLIGLFSNRGAWRPLMAIALAAWSFVAATLLYAVQLWMIGISY